jgi:hypothetical protein
MLDYRFKNEPYGHQAAYLHRFWEQREAALFADMGTGKSYMLINNMCMLYDNGRINGALIIAPKGVYRNWAELELPKHIPDHVTWSVALWNPQPSKAQKVALSRIFDIDDKLHVLVMNVEAFSSDKGKKFAERFLAGAHVPHGCRRKHHHQERISAAHKKHLQAGQAGKLSAHSNGLTYNKKSLGSVYAVCFSELRTIGLFQLFRLSVSLCRYGP